jgi:putative oxidoreductase
MQSLLARRYEQALDLARRASLPALRIALGGVFIWFGALKVANTTPVAQLVETTIPFIAPPWWVVPALGGLEVAMGIALVLGRGLRIVLPLFVAHMLSTFGVLVLQPEIAFQHGNPLLLTVEGEFVAKNVVLLAAGLTVGTRTRLRARRTTHRRPTPAAA